MERHTYLFLLATFLFITKSNIVPVFSNPVQNNSKCLAPHSCGPEELDSLGLRKRETEDLLEDVLNHENSKPTEPEADFSATKVNETSTSVGSGTTEVSSDSDSNSESSTDSSTASSAADTPSSSDAHNETSESEDISSSEVSNDPASTSEAHDFTSEASISSTLATDTTLDSLSQPDLTTENKVSSTYEVSTESTSDPETSTVSSTALEASTDFSSTSEESSDPTSTSEAPIDSSSAPEALTDSPSEVSTNSSSSSEVSTDIPSTSEGSATSSLASEKSTDIISTSEESSGSSSTSEASTDPTSNSEVSTDSPSTSEESANFSSASETSTDNISTEKSSDSSSTSEASTDPSLTSEASIDSSSTLEESTDLSSTLEASTDSTSTSEGLSGSSSASEASTNLSSTSEASTALSSASEASIDSSSTSETSTDSLSSSDASTDASSSSGASNDSSSTSEGSIDFSSTPKAPVISWSEGSNEHELSSSENFSSSTTEISQSEVSSTSFTEVSKEISSEATTDSETASVTSITEAPSSFDHQAPDNTNGTYNTTSTHETTSERILSTAPLISSSTNKSLAQNVFVDDLFPNDYNRGNYTNQINDSVLPDEGKLSHDRHSHASGAVGESIDPLFGNDEPSNFRLSENGTTAAGAIKDYELDLLKNGNSLGCLLEDREKFRRGLTATVYSETNGEPTMLSFLKDEFCVGTLSKSGRYTLRSRGFLLPQLPLKIEVEAGMFMHDRLYLFDSSPAQRVWSFKYENAKRTYSLKSHSTISTDAFLQVCGIKNHPSTNFRVKAISQFSLEDPTCIIYDQYGRSYLSQNPSPGAVSLVMAIQYLVDTQYIIGIQSIFTWLDEPSKANSVYVYGSNGELYELFRNSSDNLWPIGNFRIIPYENFPIPHH